MHHKTQYKISSSLNTRNEANTNAQIKYIDLKKCTNIMIQNVHYDIIIFEHFFVSILYQRLCIF